MVGLVGPGQARIAVLDSSIVSVAVGRDPNSPKEESDIQRDLPCKTR